MAVDTLQRRELGNPVDSSRIGPRLVNELDRYFRKPRVTLRWVFRSTHRNAERLKEEYRRKAANTHDETWMTMVALWGLLGSQNDLASPERHSAVNSLFKGVFSNRKGRPDSPFFESLDGAWVELALRENRIYQKRLRSYLNVLSTHGSPLHPYRDRNDKLRKKLTKPVAALEGNTNLDVLISGRNKGEHVIHIFIEAKFLSDISKDIEYNPVRNQIARTIDCALHLTTRDGNDLNGLNDFWFILLTPGMFRPAEYGGSSALSIYDEHVPSRGRLYCYKMKDYLNPNLLMEDLSHWKGILRNEHWKTVSDHIGWLTFENIVDTVVSHELLSAGPLGEFRRFFADRSIIPKSVSDCQR